MALRPYCIFRTGTGPIVAAALHHGHDAQPEVEALFAVDERVRLHDEDPFTGEWTQIAKTQIVALRTRFEVDLNRPRDKAVYLDPEDAWGLNVWQTRPDAGLLEELYAQYDEFYARVDRLFRELLSVHRHLVVYDLHTYNHRRDGADSPVSDWRLNPEINIGTGTMDRGYWGSLVDRFMEDLRNYDFDGRNLDVRENVKFRGGHFGKWIHETFPSRVCSIAIEVKKFFMDEWKGTARPEDIEKISKALKSTLPGVEEELKRR
jgi:N-formylglutamate amidohydrolase